MSPTVDFVGGRNSSTYVTCCLVLSLPVPSLVYRKKKSTLLLWLLCRLDQVSLPCQISVRIVQQAALGRAYFLKAKAARKEAKKGHEA